MTHNSLTWGQAQILGIRNVINCESIHTLKKSWYYNTSNICCHFKDGIVFGDTHRHFPTIDRGLYIDFCKNFCSPAVNTRVVYTLECIF